MVTIGWKYSDNKRMPENPGFRKEDDTRTRLRFWCNILKTRYMVNGSRRDEVLLKHGTGGKVPGHPPCMEIKICISRDHEIPGQSGQHGLRVILETEGGQEEQPVVSSNQGTKPEESPRM